MAYGNYYVTSNSTTSTTQYYTINYGNYYGYNSYNNYNHHKPKSKQDYKNKEMKHLLQEERGW